MSLSYEELSVVGKERFLERLNRYMMMTQVTRKALAEQTGFAASTVSTLLNDPKLISEKFIRIISIEVPELKKEYQVYRDLVDEGYLWSVGEAAQEARAMRTRWIEYEDILCNAQVGLTHLLEKSAADMREHFAKHYPEEEVSGGSGTPPAEGDHQDPG